MNRKPAGYFILITTIFAGIIIPLVDSLVFWGQYHTHIQNYLGCPYSGTFLAPRVTTLPALYPPTGIPSPDFTACSQEISIIFWSVFIGLIITGLVLIVPRKK